MNFQSCSTVNTMRCWLDWTLSYLLTEFDHGATTIIGEIFAQILHPNRGMERLRSSFRAVVFDQPSWNCTATPSVSTPRTSPTTLPNGQPDS